MVEILMSTYNGEKWMDEQIESFVNQTYTDWRLVVRDDGSSDDTVKKLYKWQEKLKKKMKIIEGENVGVVKSFEMLLARCKTEYCMYSDQDDYWKPAKMEMTLNQMKMEEKNHPGKPVAVFTSVDLVDGELKPLGKTYFQQNKLDFPFAKRFNNVCVCCPAAGCTMMLNWRARRLVLPFSEHALMHDWWIAARVAKKGVLSVLEIPTMLYRQHENNVCGAREMEKDYHVRLLGHPMTILNKYMEQRKFLREVGFRWGFVGWLFFKIRHIIHRKCA